MLADGVALAELVIAPSSYLAELAPLLFPGSCKERILAVVAAYFDDSGTHATGPVITVGGYWSTVDRWVTLETEWRAFLKELGLGFFRMADFENRKKPPYDKWSKRKHDYVIKRFIGIIKRNTFGSVSRCILKASYHALDAQDRRLIGTPQTLCAEISISALLEKMKKENYNGDVAYFLEAGPGWGEILQRSLSEEWRRDFRVASLVPMDKKRAPQLQAADVLAYEAGKDALRHCGFHTRPRRKSIETLLKRGSHDNAIYRTEDHVRSIVEVVREARGK